MCKSMYIYIHMPLDRFVAHVLAGLVVRLPIQDFLCVERIKVVLLSGLGSLPSSPVISFFSVSFVVFRV